LCLDTQGDPSWPRLAPPLCWAPFTIRIRHRIAKVSRSSKFWKIACELCCCCFRCNFPQWSHENLLLKFTPLHFTANRRREPLEQNIESHLTIPSFYLFCVSFPARLVFCIIRSKVTPAEWNDREPWSGSGRRWRWRWQWSWSG